MNAVPRSRVRSSRATTFVDLLASLVVVVVVVGVVLPGLARRWRRQGAPRIHCVNNLKNVGLAFRIFATDNEGRYPYQIDEAAGGTKSTRMAPSDLWKQYLVLSNELTVPRLLVCPEDLHRPPAPAWAAFTNRQQISYHLGVETPANRPELVLSGDRNLSLSGAPLEAVTVTLDADSRISFDPRLHHSRGNILMADGGVQQATSARLRETMVQASRAATNVVLVIP